MDSMLPAPSPELPKPAQTPLESAGSERIEVSPDVKEAAPAFERLNDASNAVSQAMVSAPGQPAQPSIQADNPLLQAGTSNPAVADDVDVIEKEWVQKAKSIVSKTRHDPHAQTVELTHMKHDYMQKRYGREIKQLDESSA